MNKEKFLELVVKSKSLEELSRKIIKEHLDKNESNEVDDDLIEFMIDQQNATGHYFKNKLMDMLMDTIGVLVLCGDISNLNALIRNLPDELIRACEYHTGMYKESFITFGKQLKEFINLNNHKREDALEYIEMKGK